MPKTTRSPHEQLIYPIQVKTKSPKRAPRQRATAPLCSAGLSHGRRAHSLPPLHKAHGFVALCRRPHHPRYHDTSNKMTRQRRRSTTEALQAQVPYAFAGRLHRPPWVHGAVCILHKRSGPLTSTGGYNMYLPCTERNAHDLPAVTVPPTTTDHDTCLPSKRTAPAFTIGRVLLRSDGIVASLNDDAVHTSTIEERAAWRWSPRCFVPTSGSLH